MHRPFASIELCLGFTLAGQVYVDDGDEDTDVDDEDEDVDDEDEGDL